MGFPLQFSGSRRRAALSFLSALTIALAAFFAASAAEAACTLTSGTGTANAPNTGAVVTCSGTDTGGVVNNTATNVTVNVLAGATLSNNTAGPVIWLNGFNSISNLGTINGGVGAYGIDVGDNNNPAHGVGIVNAGTIALGANSFGIASGDYNLVTNSGSITAGALSYGIRADSNNNLYYGTGVTNSGTIALGALSYGISVSDYNTVTNSGSITAGANSYGVFAGSNNSSSFGSGITNSGTITLGNSSFGISVSDYNTVANRGSITAGTSSYGILAGSNNSVFYGTGITNSGTIVLGDSSYGISVGFFNSVTNSGSITVGANGYGISASNTNNAFFGTGIVNSGAIAVGDHGTGINVGDYNSVTNSGTITMTGAHTVGIKAAGNNNTASGAGITNSGTITMQSGFGIIVGSNNTVTNSGNITGQSGHGIDSSGGTGTYIANSGTIAFGDGNNNVGINSGSNDIVNNSGTITVGNRIGAGSPNVGIQLGAGSSLLNTGVVRAGATSYSVFGSTNSTVTNSGTLDGELQLVGSSSVLTNQGLITITAAGTPVGFVQAIAGSFNQTSTGTLALRVAPAAYDSLTAGLVAYLNGTLRATVQPGLYGNTTTYPSVVGAGLLVGNFAQATSSSPFFTASATPNGNNVDLTLTRIRFNAVGGLNRNQTAVGSGLENGYSIALTGNAATLYGNLLATTGNPATIYKQLSGEGITSTQHAAFMANSLFTNTMMDEAIARRGDDAAGVQTASVDAAGREALGYAPAEPEPVYKPTRGALPPVFVPRWRAWGGAYGGRQTTKGDSDSGSSDATQSVFGGVIGIERRVSSDMLYGLAVGASSAHFNVADLDTSGDASGGHFGAYGMYSLGRAYFAGTLAYSHYNNKTTRTVATLGETENGSFGSNQIGSKLEAGYRMRFGSVAVTPFAGVQIAQLWQGGFTETAGSGAGLGALTFASQSTTSLPASLGAQFDMRFAMGGMALATYVRTAWVHEFRPNRNGTATFAAIPTTFFTVDGPRASRDAARLDAGAELALNVRMALFAKFGGEFSGSSGNYSGMGGMRYTW